MINQNAKDDRCRRCGEFLKDGYCPDCKSVSKNIEMQRKIMEPFHKIDNEKYKMDNEKWLESLMASYDDSVSSRARSLIEQHQQCRKEGKTNVEALKCVVGQNAKSCFKKAIESIPVIKESKDSKLLPIDFDEEAEWNALIQDG